MSVWSRIRQIRADPVPPWQEDAPNSPEPALEAFDTAICQKAQSLYEKAIELEAAGRPHEAIAKYGEALEIVPVFWEALDNRALGLMRLGDQAAAIADLERSARVAPDSFLAFFALIECYKETKQFRKAYRTTTHCFRRWRDQFRR